MKKMKMQVRNEVTFEEGCDQYLMDCRARNLRDGTIKHYKESMKLLFKHIDPSTPISSFGKDTMDLFVIDLKEKRNLNDVSLCMQQLYGKWQDLLNREDGEILKKIIAVDGKTMVGTVRRKRKQITLYRHGAKKMDIALVRKLLKKKAMKSRTPGIVGENTN